LYCIQIGSYIKTRLRNSLSLFDVDAWMLMNLNEDILVKLTQNIRNEIVKHNSLLKKSFNNLD